ncbi:HAMP domain-containing histidine kinase [Sphingomonas sp. A2-49]|uniref:sensor histidine kinase n=1 Tax=Sphingomonas sp. A2-49 TaxID=1391375 RepID=UPI0021D3A8D7|nr:HAMP domain-containing sensor histidine kinase [Sphingomonas sp. A2-49]MCU6454991.1 HAMP domain-containing histidine kinase [Sphingomonas sp. A2-49]
MRLSVTARIALLSIALALVSNLVLVGFVWRQTDAAVIGTVRRETIEQSDAMRAIYRVGGLSAVVEAIGHARASGDTSLLLAVLDRNGARVAGYAPPRIAIPLAPTPFRIADIDASAATVDIGYILHPIGDHWLLNGRRLDLVEAERRAVEDAFTVAVLLSLVLGVGAGLVLARYVGTRLNDIAAVIEAAGEGDLSRRVPVAPTRRDAFDRLANQLNLMLGKLERLMVELRLVTDSLAHDLRSPLTRLRTKTEQAVLIADPAAREAALGGLLVETDLVMRMLTMVIEISRSESVSRERFILVEPAELVEEIAELYEPVAEEAGLDFTVAIDVSAPAMLLHRELVSQAITNLIDNALKHAAAGGVLTLRLVANAGEIAIQVEDRGGGIAESDRAQALKRFGRLDAARTTPGAGLGMALIEAVARLHNGRFELADNAPGLIARIVLPV